VIVLETERLLFRDHQESDLETFCAMEMDPEVRRFVGGYPRTRADAEHKFRTTFLRARKTSLPFCATIYKPEGRYIGRCGLHPVPVNDAGLGFYLARAYWGRGLATEAARAFVDYGFRVLRLPRIVSSVEAGNDGSVRVLENVGFKWVRFEQGERRSFHHYMITDSAR
jgi:RimJ/RimL family protein N-acetyltransferase